MTIRRSQSLAIAAALLFASACTSEPNGSDMLSAQSGGLSGGGAGGIGGVAAGGSGGSLIGGTAGDPPLAASGGSGGAAGIGGMSGGVGGMTAGASGVGGMSGGVGGGGGGGMGATVETVPTLYWLDINGNRVMRSQSFADGEAIVTGTGTAPDGVAVDVAGGKVYWSNMGSLFGTGGGTLQRANLDGTEVETIIAAGVARTPKQMQVDLVNRHVYFCDREGAKVWRAGMDGASPEAIVSGHGFRELVGIALDVPEGKFYFTDRIGKKILRANIDMPAGETGADRTDIEEMFVFSGTAMPIDLDIDHVNRRIYWTDRDLGTVHRGNLEIPAGQTAANRTDAETLVDGLVETIGLSLDVENDKMYFTELGGSVSEAALDGTGLMRRILSSGSATGVAIAHIPK